MTRRLLVLVAVLFAGAALLVAPAAAHAAAAAAQMPAAPLEPTPPTPPTPPGINDATSITIGFPDVSGDGASNTVLVILGLTLLAVAPSLLVLMTSFTRIIVVLSLVRNATGFPTIPPNQVLAGIALFLSLFVMAPVLSEINTEAVAPLRAGEIELEAALDRAQVPLREFMLKHTRDEELKLFLDAGKVETPVVRDEIPLTSLIPAFVLSELRSAFIIGFALFLPFLIIDLVISAVLVSLGMMMLPPTFVSLPFKLLMFIMLSGWTMVAETLLRSYV
jgi:flagellar biosynthesis protein FliP